MKIVLKLMADIGIPRPYEGHIAVLYQKEDIIRTISKIIEKDFAKNWYISHSGWNILKNLLQQNFENKFWKSKHSDKTSLHSSKMIMESIDGTILKTTSTDHIRYYCTCDLTVRPDSKN